MADRFSDDVIQKAWSRSGGRCECTRSSHGHYGRCNKQLSYYSRGKETPMGWEAHHKDSNGPATLSNCEILCQECHKKTKTYGKN